MRLMATPLPYSMADHSLFMGKMLLIRIEKIINWRKFSRLVLEEIVVISKENNYFEVRLTKG